MQIPQSRYDAKFKTEFSSIGKSFVNLGTFVPWRLKKVFLPVFISFACVISTFSQVGDTDWPLFRGKADLSGRYDSELPSAPNLLWSVSTGTRTKSSPVISDGTLFFGNDKGTLIAVSSDGKIKWKYEAGSLIEAAPLIFGNKVIVGLNDGRLIAADKVTGKLIWTYTTDNQISGSANVWVSGSNAGIVVGSYDYYLHCIDPRTGKEIWKIETNNYVNGTPSIEEGKIVFGGCDGMIRVVDPLTGSQKDTVDIGVYIAASPALAGDMAYFGDYDGKFFGLNIKTRKISWEIPGNDQSGSVLAVPAVGNNSVVIGREDKYLYCYNATDGKLIWKYRTNGRIVGSAVIARTEVLFTSMDGTVNIIGLANGKKRWSFNTGTPISSSPAVIKGKFYILTEDGRLLAFGEKNIAR
jgi:eukaryotic-like serine/threonine-protein kinase